MSKSLDVNMNFVPPPETKNYPRKCPFCKIYHFKGGFDQKYDTTIKNAEKIEEEFQDCIGEKCARWTPIGCK